MRRKLILAIMTFLTVFVMTVAPAINRFNIEFETNFASDSLLTTSAFDEHFDEELDGALDKEIDKKHDNDHCHDLDESPCCSNPCESCCAQGIVILLKHVTPELLASKPDQLASSHHLSPDLKGLRRPPKFT